MINNYPLSLTSLLIYRTQYLMSARNLFKNKIITANSSLLRENKYSCFHWQCCKQHKKTLISSARYWKKGKKKSFYFIVDERSHARQDLLVYHTGIHLLHPRSPFDRHTATRWKCSCHLDRQSVPLRTSAHGKLGKATKAVSVLSASSRTTFIIYSSPL